VRANGHLGDAILALRSEAKPIGGVQPLLNGGMNSLLAGHEASQPAEQIRLSHVAPTPSAADEALWRSRAT
jgi:hypothetical protein